SGNLGAGSLTVAGSSTLSGTSVSTDVSINSGALTLAGNNRLAANASVTVSNAATLNIGSGSQTLAALSGNGGVSNNGSLGLDGGTSSSFAGSIFGNGSLTMSGAGTLTLAGSNSFTGGTFVNAGELALASTNALSRTNAINVAGGTLKTLTDFQTAGVVSLSSGSITGAGSLSAGSFALTSGMASAVLAGNASVTKTGAGTVTLSGGNTYSGGTTLSAGTLVASHFSALGNPTNSLTVNGGTLDLGGTTNTQGTVTVAGGSITNGGLNATNFQVQTGSVAANLGGIASLTKSGSGTATLSASNSYTAGTTLREGALLLSGSSATLGASTNALTVAGGILDLGATNRTVGAFTLRGGSVTNGTLASSSYALESGILRAGLSGSGSMTKAGSGDVALHGNSSGYSGAASITQGRLEAFATNAIGSGTVTLSGSSSSAQGVLALQTNLTIGALNWGTNGVIALTPGAMTLNILGLLENAAGGGVFDFGSFSTSGTNTILTFATSTNFTTSSFSVLGSSQWGFGLSSTSLSAFYLGGESITNNSNTAITNSTTNSTLKVDGGTTVIAAGVTSTSTNSVSVNGGNIVTLGSIVTPTVTVTAGGLGVAQGGSITASNSVTASGDNSVIVNNGEITTPVLALNNGGTLLGSGRVIGDVRVDGGNVSPGNSPGTLTVTGNYSVSSGALNIEVASPSNYDKVVVTGVATLGGSLNLIPYDGYVMQFGDNYTFLTAAGGISGSYSATNTPAGIRARLMQSQTSLSALIAPASYTQVAVTQNQVNVAHALDGFIPATSGDKATVSTALDSLTASQYSPAFEAIQPTIYQSLSTIAFNNANAQNMGLVQRLWNQRIAGSGFSMSGFADNTPFLEGQGNGKSVMDPNKDILRPSPDNNWGLFVDGNGIFAQANSGNMLPNYNAQGGGVTTGVTYRVNPVISVGTYVGYQGTYAKYNGGSSMTDNSVRFGGFATYGRQDGKGFFADGILGGGYNSYQVTRNIQFGSINRTANSAPSAGELDSMLATGYDFKKGMWTFGPTASLQYTYFGANSFSENGAQSLNLSNVGWNTSSMLSSLGAHAAFTWQATKDLVVVPQLNLSWQHEFLQNPYSINSSLGGASLSNLSSAPIRDFLYTGVGVTFEFKQKWSSSIFYNAAAGNSDLQSQNIFLSFGAKF
ncbi:MAG: autotransporter domain-containing protein, partial [Verrucomicrobia bacterium]|nr:autotransporter domain-containing protein [Verrucomicrobiota bacterium]